MEITPKDAALLSLASKDTALSEASDALNHRLTGDPAIDQPIQLALNNIYAERVAIASRRSAISAGGKFTAPNDADMSNLQAAVTAVHNAVTATANAGVLMELATSLLGQFSAAKSQAPNA